MSLQCPLGSVCRDSRIEVRQNPFAMPLQTSPETAHDPNACHLRGQRIHARLANPVSRRNREVGATGSLCPVYHLSWIRAYTRQLAFLTTSAHWMGCIRKRMFF